MQFFSQIHALFWRTIYRPKTAVAYKKWQIWGMYSPAFGITNSQGDIDWQICDHHDFAKKYSCQILHSTSECISIETANNWILSLFSLIIQQINTYIVVHQGVLTDFWTLIQSEFTEGVGNESRARCYQKFNILQKGSKIKYYNYFGRVWSRIEFVSSGMQ